MFMRIIVLRDEALTEIVGGAKKAHVKGRKPRVRRVATRA
jgi:hypothetical protein